MKTHRLGLVALLASLNFFCSSLSAQTDQPFSVQVSGLLNWTDTNQRWESGVEGQIRWTGGAWSISAGVQSTSSGKKYTEPFTHPGPDDLDGTSDDWVSNWDYNVSTLGFFLEPRLVVAVFSDRFGLYVFSRVGVSRMTEDESGIKEETEACCEGGVRATGRQEAYSVEGSRVGFGAYAGPGLLVRLTSRANLDLGVTLGGAYWGEPNTGLTFEETAGNSGWLRGPKDFFVVGMWVGLVIGIG